jgi:ferritin-like metal-binding protein YciE
LRQLHGDIVKDTIGKIEQLGGQISQIKTGLSGMIGYFGGRATGASSDEAVKNGISDYTNESMEIASYEAIKAGAEEMGDSETARLADEILEEEKGMAAWLSETMPGLVKRYLSQAQA